MTEPQVQVRGGTGFDLLLSAIPVADQDWRDVLVHGPEVASVVRRDGGARVTREASRLGRFGWINLVGLLAAKPGTGSRADLVALLARTPAPELRFVVAGGRRLQLTSRLGADRLRAALAGDPAAGRELARALRSPGMLLDVAPWIRRTGASQLKDALQGAVDQWPDLPDRMSAASAGEYASTRLADIGPAAMLAEVTPGIRYEPGVLQRVVLVGSALVEPILVAVDQADLTVIVHPPLRPDGMADAASGLRRLGDAVGDESRILVLQALRDGSKTLAELCSSLGRPRTTLLHHLALLRAGGFVTLTVSAGDPNVYRLDPAGFEALARFARGFVIDRAAD